MFVEPLYEYLDEALDDRRALLSLLLRYKHSCEWFRRDRLFRRWQDDRRRGEKVLALDLYEFLYNQGIEFSIDPWSASGEADLVSSQIGDSRIIADAKVFEGTSSHGPAHLGRAFNQLYSYTQDYNEPFGYLVVFQTGPDGLRFALSTSGSGGVPYLQHNGKMIFFVVIDIFKHDSSASRRGRARVTEVKEADLVMEIESPTEVSESEAMP